MSSPSTPWTSFSAWLYRRPLLNPALLFSLLLVLVYFGMPSDELTFDNAFIVGDDTRLRSFSLGSLKLIFSRDYWWPSFSSSLFRPLSTLTFWFEYSVLGYGERAIGYQLCNAAMHLGIVMLVFTLARRLRLGEAVAWGAALLFALHPVGTEVVPNIVGRCDLLAAGTVLAGLLAYLIAIERPDPAERWRLFGVSGIFALLGILMKESAVVLPALVFWHGLLRLDEWRVGGAARKAWQSDAMRALVVFLPALLVCFGIRWWFTRDSGVAEHPFIDNPLVIESFWVSRLSALGVWGMQIRALFMPLGLSNDYSFNAIPAAVLPFGNETALWGWGMVLLCLVSLAGLVCWRKRPAGVAFLLGAYVLTMLPTSNLIVLIGSIRADRFHYLPSAFLWLALLSIILATPAARFARRPLLVGAIAWATCLAVIAHARCYDWRDNLRLWSSALAAAPNSVKALAGAANTMQVVRGDEEGTRVAIDRLSRAVEIYRASRVPREHWPILIFSDLGGMYLNLFDFLVRDKKPEAERALVLEKSLAALEEGMEIEAVVRERWTRMHLDQGSQVAPFNELLRRNYATVLGEKKRYAEAIQVMEDTIKVSPLALSNRELLAKLADQSGDPQKALDELILCRVIEPSRPSDLAHIGALAKKTKPESEPLVRDSGGTLRLNLDDPAIEQSVRAALTRYTEILRGAGLELEAKRMKRVARHNYGIEL